MEAKNNILNLNFKIMCKTLMKKLTKLGGIKN